MYRVIAEAYGAPLPAGKLYRMPECKLGKECVNPNHLGTETDYVLALNGRRQEIPEPSRAVKVIKLTPQDRRFLKSLRVRWDEQVEEDVETRSTEINERVPSRAGLSIG